ncbi:MAG: MFS transporter [Conexibacter sp.]
MALDVRTPAPAPAAPRRLGRAGAFRVVAFVIALAMGASGVPSPLYEIFQQHWHFSTFLLTLVFAVYCGGVLTSLLLAGRVSDELGRRPVLIVALAGMAGGTLLFIAAQSVAWLIAARALQGLATGAALATASAALLDFHPAGDAEHAGFVNGIVSGAGMASGIFVSALLAQYGPAPRVLPFVVLLALIVLTLAAVRALPESVARAASPQLRPARPHVPRSMRSAFVLASLGVSASWSVMGVVLALGPKLTAELSGSANHLAGGASVLGIVVAATLASALAQHVEVRRATANGSLVLALGLLLMAASLSTGSAAAFAGAGVIVGIGFGIAFLGALRSLTGAVPDHHRAEVMAAFYLVAYGANALPALAAGLAVAHLQLFATFRIFAVAVALVALAAALAALRMAPAVAAVEPAGA